jgi:glycosyltransferase involved in cell wall biosynthesis
VSAATEKRLLQTLLIPLGVRSATTTDSVQRLLDCDEPIVFPLAQLADGGRRMLRSRSFEQLAVAGAPPADELGYGLTTLVAILGRPKEVTLVDLDTDRVRSEPLLRFIAKSTPTAVGQFAGSALLLSAQRAAIPLAARRRTNAYTLAPELRNLVYLLPVVGAGFGVGGSVTHSHEVIRALRAEGVAMEAFTTSAAIARTALVDPHPPCEWRLIRIPRVAKAIAASAAAGADVALFRAALAAARTADAIYQRHARFSLAGALLARASGKPLILEYNGPEEFVERHWMDGRTPMRSRIRLCEDAALAAAARIIVVSEADRRSLLKRGVERERIVLNPNGVDAGRFAVGGGEETRHRHGLADGRLVVGFVGSFGPWHGAPVLARAFVSLAKSIPAAQLLLVGDGRELGPSVEIVRDAGLDQHLTVAGRVRPSAIPAYLDACDILVAPHVPLADGVEFFGSPTKLFEYMAAEKAILASRLGQIGEVLEHGVTGWLVEPGNCDDLRKGLFALADAPELRATLGANARRRAIEHHSWRLNARRVMDSYSELANKAAA